MPPKKNKAKDDPESMGLWGGAIGSTWDEEIMNNQSSRLPTGQNGVAGGSLYDSASRSTSWGPPPVSKAAARFANSPGPHAPFKAPGQRSQYQPPSGALPTHPRGFMDPGPSHPPFFPFATPAVPNVVPSAARGPEPKPQSTTPDHPMSRTLTLAAALPSKALNAATPSGPLPHDAKITDSRGAGIVDATRPLYGTHRPVSERIIWTMEPEHDERVTFLLDWIDEKAWALAKFGAEKFLSTKKRGALVSNAGYVSRNHPEDPVFDWFTFDNAQRTFDRTLQESIASYDPATTVIIFVFLVSDSYSSMAVWRKLVTLPASIELRMNVPLEKLKAELRKSTNVVQIKSPALWTGPPPKATPVSSPTTTSSWRTPVTPPIRTVIIKEPVTKVVEVVEVEPKKKKKKPKWWQFWKRIKLEW